MRCMWCPDPLNPSSEYHPYADGWHVPIEVQLKTKLVYITLGNSDNKLTQQEWSNYCNKVFTFVKAYARTIFIMAYAEPSSRYQNAICGAVFMENDLLRLREQLRVEAKRYQQDSIALVVVDKAEMITP